MPTFGALSVGWFVDLQIVLAGASARPEPARAKGESVMLPLLGWGQ
jgi:hypothetical protein